MKASRSYWRRTAKVGRSVYRSGLFDNLDEQAGPAYFDGLWLSRRLFWHRLKLGLQLVPNSGGNRCLDYGCGFGFALPLLSERYGSVVGVDHRPALSRAFIARWCDASNTQLPNIQIASSIEESTPEENSVDLILALDVLEHIELLTRVLSQLHSMLAPGGLLIVSGPTENWMYRLGRKMVGFSGAYHCRDIYEILAVMERKFMLEPPQKLLPCLPLFLITKATKLL